MSEAPIMREELRNRTDRTDPTYSTDRIAQTLSLRIPAFADSPLSVVCSRFLVLCSLWSVVCCLFFSLPARADTILGISDWDANVDPWTSYYGWSTLGTPASGGNPDGWLSITFTNTTAETPDETWRDIARMTATNLYAGDWDTNMWVSFDFWQSNVVAGAIQVQWKSSTNANIWGYALTPSESTGGTNWTTFTAPLLDWSDWAYPFATEEQFLADLASIDWIGVSILRDTTTEQIFGIDNFALMVPEPEELAMLAAAALAALISLRRRRQLQAIAVSIPSASHGTGSHKASSFR